ncbi:MAG: GHKL domain-containing protein [Peptostreptococcaceae bacterium]|nr:GHKL domain-containing protein [Peptostreptococcaceae bacterium]
MFMTKNEKIQKYAGTLQPLVLSLIVALSSSINFNFLGYGFIVALSVIMLEVIIYAFNYISILKLTVFTAILSPGFRLLLTALTSGSINMLLIKDILPDVFYFLTFGVVYTLLRQILNRDKGIINFLVIIFFSDMMSNVIELSVRGIIFDKNLLLVSSVSIIMIIAFVRTIIIGTIVICINANSQLILKAEHDEEYKRLVILYSVFESELYIMNKNSVEIEDIMKKAYTLHNELRNYEVPKELADISLDISKDAHEIKGDYKRSLEVLRQNFIKNYSNNTVHVNDIVYIIKADVMQRISARELNIQFNTTIKTNFIVSKHYELVAVLRNLINNAIEAIDKNKGKINVYIYEKEDKYIFEVGNSGSSISQSDLPHIFKHGYSSKFNEETGDIQRGIGLVIVKDYVEKLFSGTIEVETKEDYTNFIIRIPKISFES